MVCNALHFISRCAFIFSNSSRWVLDFSRSLLTLPNLSHSHVCRSHNKLRSPALISRKLNFSPAFSYSMAIRLGRLASLSHRISQHLIFGLNIFSSSGSHFNTMGRWSEHGETLCINFFAVKMFLHLLSATARSNRTSTFQQPRWLLSNVNGHP